MKHSNSFYQHYINKHAEAGHLIVQPRMGFSRAELMREGLLAVKSLDIPVIGTITVDSFTRSGDFKSAKRAIETGRSLNGYPIVSYNKDQNQALIANTRAIDFPVQVRHGSPLPEEIFKATIAAGIDAIEGGPISYCLPYSRVPLSESIDAWARCCRLFAEAGNGNYHIESFGGCMMGQLCPPSMLIVITLLEALFFKFYGIKSVSVSLAQGTNSNQDLAALQVLRELSDKYLGDEVDWHIVFYSFMGKFPSTYLGAKTLIEESAVIAKLGGASRLIVKTVNEAHQIPTIQDNLDALTWAHQKANITSVNNSRTVNKTIKDQIYQEADLLLTRVLNLANNPGIAMDVAFQKGYLDIPFCLHQSNSRGSLSRIDASGNIVWAALGNMPLSNESIGQHTSKKLTSALLFDMLSFNQLKYDQDPNEIDEQKVPSVSI